MVFLSFRCRARPFQQELCSFVNVRIHTEGFGVRLYFSICIMLLRLIVAQYCLQNAWRRQPIDHLLVIIYKRNYIANPLMTESWVCMWGSLHFHVQHHCLLYAVIFECIAWLYYWHKCYTPAILPCIDQVTIVQNNFCTPVMLCSLCLVKVRLSSLLVF